MFSLSETNSFIGEKKKKFIWLFISENSLKKYELENILSQNKNYGTPKSQRR